MFNTNFIVKVMTILKIIQYLSKLFFSFILTFIIILFFTKITMNLKAIYYYDALNLNIIEEYNLYAEKYTSSFQYINSITLKQNYNYIIKYIQNYDKKNFKLPSIPFSSNGKKHFEDVRSLIINGEYIFITSIILFMLVSFITKKNYLLFCLKASGKELIIICIFACFLSFFNFSELFDAFHKIIFSNNYWLFNPQYDPVILIFPEEYFMHCAIIILFFSLITGILFYIKGK